jgi:hypothetical protein
MAPGIVAKPDYDFNSTQRSGSGSITLKLNPWVVGVRAGFALLVVTLVLGIGFDILRRRSLSRHPASGTLMVVDERGVPLHSRGIGGRNYIKLTRFPATTRIRWMEVTSRSDTDSKAGLVHVKGRLDDSSAFGGSLSPGGGRLPLGKYKIYLTKTQ